MTETSTKEGRGRPAIETRELPPGIRFAIQARSQGLTWKAAADRAGTTATRVRGFMQRHPDAKACLEGCLQDQLDQSHSILIEAAPEAAQCLIDIIRDGRCKPYSKIEAVKTLFAIVEKGKTEREVADALKSLKDQLTALEGGPVYDV